MPIHTAKARAKKKHDVTQSIMGNKNTRSLMKKVDPPKKKDALLRKAAPLKKKKLPRKKK